MVEVSFIPPDFIHNRFRIRLFPHAYKRVGIAFLTAAETMDTLIPVYPVPALRKAVRSCGALFYACPAADAPIRIQQDFLFLMNGFRVMAPPAVKIAALKNTTVLTPGPSCTEKCCILKILTVCILCSCLQFSHLPVTVTSSEWLS